MSRGRVFRRCLPISDPASDEVILSNEKIELVFTKIGGRLKRASVLLGEEGTIQLVPEAPGRPDTETVYPLGLRFRHTSLRDELDFRRFEAELSPSGKSVLFTLDLPGNAAVQKRFTLNEESYLLDIDVQYRNLESTSRALGLDIEPAYVLNWGPGMIAREEGTYFKPSMIWLKEESIEHQYINKLPDADETPDSQRLPSVDWMGYRTKYFLAALRESNGDVTTSDAWFEGNQSQFRFGIQVPAFKLDSGETHQQSFQLFLGPMQETGADRRLARASRIVDLFRLPEDSGFLRETATPESELVVRVFPQLRRRHYSAHGAGPYRHAASHIEEHEEHEGHAGPSARDQGNPGAVQGRPAGNEPGDDGIVPRTRREPLWGVHAHAPSKCPSSSPSTA